MPYKRILVPVDGSPVASLGLREAARMARAGRARLRLLHVIEEYHAFAQADAGAYVGPLLEAMRDAARRTLAKVERRARTMRVRPETALAESLGGRVADAIIDDARRWRADLIVMGTHGRRGVGRLLLGSDAEIVVRRSPVPVLLVPGRRAR